MAYRVTYYMDSVNIEKLKTQQEEKQPWELISNITNGDFFFNRQAQEFILLEAVAIQLVMHQS